VAVFLFYGAAVRSYHLRIGSIVGQEFPGSSLTTGTLARPIKS